MRTLTMFGLALAVAACTEARPAPVPQLPPEAPPGPVVHWEEQGPALPIDHPPIDRPPASRRAGRLSVLQLRGAFASVAGTQADGGQIMWGTTADGFTTFAAALGQADLSNITQNNDEPTPLYLKYVDDAAREVCGKMLAADGTRAQAQRSLMRHVEPSWRAGDHPAEVDENLRFLKLRFHTVRVEPADDAAIADLRALFVRVTQAPDGGAGASGAEGWRAVCVALFMAPEFHLY